MSAERLGADPSVPDASAGDPALPGRVSVSTRALERVFAAVAAEQLGAPIRSVSASVGDRAGSLGVRVSGPGSPASGATLLDTAQDARRRVRDEGGRIAGSIVSDVDVRLTGLVGDDAGRVAGGRSIEPTAAASFGSAASAAAPAVLAPADARLTRTLVRRESRRSRSVAVSVLLVILALAAAYVGVECGLAASGVPALLLSPAAALVAWRAGDPLVVAGAVVAAVIGIAAIVLAIAPGRRPRHTVADDRAAILVDDAVLASAVSRAISRRAGVAPGQVRTSVGRRRVEVSVTPTSGRPVDRADLAACASDELTALDLRPAPVARLRVAETGVVGA